jgi:hypothetical protein
MAAITVDHVIEDSGPIKVYRFDSVATTNTWVYDSNSTADAPSPIAWWIENIEDSAKVTATYSSGSFTFTVSTGTPAIDLFIVQIVKKSG